MLRNRLAIILIIVLAILIRITAIFILGSPKVWECEEITDNILAGKGFFFVWLEAKHFSHTEPFYSYLSSLVYLLSRHSHLAMVLVQIFISVLLILIVYLIGKTIFNLTAGSISAFIVAIHPGFIYYDVKNLHPLGLGAMFIALSVWLMILFKKNPSLKMASLTGFVSGIGTLARGTVGSFYFLGIFWAYAQLRKNKKIYKFLFAMIACFTIAILPWTLRNYVILKKIVPIREGVYIGFWYGNNDNASGAGHNLNGQSMIELMSPELKKKVTGANEFEQDRIFREEAVKFIKNNPVRFLDLTLKKILYFWWFSPVVGLIYPQLYTVIYKGFYAVFFLLFLSGVYFAFKKEETKAYVFLFLLLFLAVAITHALTYVECRHRWGIEPLMALFVGFSISRIENILRR